MSGLRLGLGLSGGGGNPPAFSISFTGLSTDSLGTYGQVGNHAAISYTISPDNGTETVKWSNSSNPADAATFGTGASPTDFTSVDGFSVYLHVTDDPVDDPDVGPVTRTFSFPVRYAPGAFAALDAQSFTQNSGDQTYFFAAATGSNLTWTYELCDGPAGVSMGDFDFHVDSVSGSDSNAGTEAEPFQTLAKAVTEINAAGAGSSVGFARGSVWREAFAPTPNGCTLGTYGTGASPIVNGADIVTAWTAEGTANVWETTITHDGVSSDRLRVWEDGVQLEPVVDVATCSSTPGSFVIVTTASDPSPTLVRIHPSDSGDPTSNGMEYEVTVRRRAVIVGDDWTVNGDIETLKAISNGGSFLSGTGSDVSRQLVTEGSKHNMLVESGEISDFIAVDNDGVIAAEPISTLHVSYMDDTTGESILYRRVGAILTRGQVGTFAWYAHSNSVSDLYASAILEQCWAVNTSGAWIGNPGGGADGLANNIARGLFIKNGVNCMGGATNQQNLALSGAQYHATNLQYGFTATDCAVYYPQGSPSGNAAVMWNANNDFTGEWTNCAWVFSATGTNNMMTNTGTRTGSMAINNTIFFNGSRHISLPPNITYTGDHNIFVVQSQFEGTTKFRSLFNNTEYSTLAAWQTATSADANSVYADKADQTAGNANALWLAYAEAAGGTDLTTIGPAVGDFRINPNARVYDSSDVAYIGEFPDSTPITEAGPQNHWDWNLRQSVSGPPTQFPTVPETLADSRTYIANPAAWDFYA